LEIYGGIYIPQNYYIYIMTKTTLLLCQSNYNINNMSLCIENYFQNSCSDICKWLKTVNYDSFLVINNSSSNNREILIESINNIRPKRIITIGAKVNELMLGISPLNCIVYPFDKNTNIINIFMRDVFIKHSN